MSAYNVNLTLENIRTITIMFLDIFIMWMVLYYAIQLVRSNSKTVQIFKGIMLVLIIDAIATFLGLKTVSYVTNIFINWGFLAIIIIFQPEIRSVLERLGKTNVFSRMTTLTGNEKENLVDQIVTATMLLSQDQTGALISIEQSHTLEDFIATGTKLNSDVSAELLTSLFVTSTPLHDGAVIIQGDKIACASAYFPPTNLDLPSRYGARHRAAIGISEITDAVTIVVSEETGAISITEGGKITTVNRRQLRDYLLRVICGEETDVVSSRRPRLNNEAAREVIIDDSGEKPAKKDKDDLGRTGVLSKLAIKKQEDKTGKIEVEEVVNAETVKPAVEEQPNAEMARLEEGANEIKLPKKKDRPAPSYPESTAAHRFEEQKRAELEAQAELQRAQRAEMELRERRRQEAEAEARRREAEQRVREADEARRREMEAKRQAAEAMRRQQEEMAAERRRQEQIAQERRRQQELMERRRSEELFARRRQEEMAARRRAEEMNATRRMSVEEVRAAREASKQRLSGRPAQPGYPQNDIEMTQQSRVITDTTSHQFDTTRLDISKIMGMNDELTKTFEMLDNLPDGDDQEGGDR